MALYATNRFPGDGTTTSYEFNFVGKYIARTHVKVYQEDNVTKVRTYVSINDSNFLNDTTLLGLPVTPVGSTLVIYRETPKPPLVDFVNGSRFTEYNLDLVARQGLFVAMEALDAGGIEALQQLRDAIAVIAGLVDDATAAVSDATVAALAAQTALDSFDDRYLGQKPADPANDNDGGALLVGALYFRTTAPIGMKVWTGTAWDDAYANLSAKFDKTGGDVNGNINFVGPGRRITGDFSNASFSNRVMFQSSTTNANTDIGILPNGLASSAGIWAFNNGSDLTNTAFLRSYINGATDVRFESGRAGVYSFLPITFHTGGSERMRIDTSGNVGIGEAPSSQYKFQAANGNWCIHSDVGQLFIESSGRVNRWWIAANISDTVNDGLYIGRGGSGIGTGTAVLKILNDTTHINPNGGLGYGAGAGGTVVQATSKSTAVTLNKPTGQITMNNAALAAGTEAFFRLNCSLLNSTDIPLVTVNYSGAYTVRVYFVGAGFCEVAVRNVSSGTLSEAVVLGFAIIKGAAS